MKKVIKINGQEMGTINLRDSAHFQVQLNNRTQIVKSKRVYDRNKAKQEFRRNEF